MAQKQIVPSLICTDLCNLESEVQDLESLGCEMLHIDIIDGLFSPDMPVGIETVRQLRKKTNLLFDVHLMATNNTPYVEQLLTCGVNRVCFHPEYEPRPTILLRKIREMGVKAGLAISPETTVESLEYLLLLCDFVLLMRIDAGYAHLDGQVVYPQTEEKIVKLHRFSNKYHHPLNITVDGRVGFEETAKLLTYGVDMFVSGSSGLFCRSQTREQNYLKLQSILKGG